LIFFISPNLYMEVGFFLIKIKRCAPMEYPSLIYKIEKGYVSPLTFSLYENKIQNVQSQIFSDNLIVQGSTILQNENLISNKFKVVTLENMGFILFNY
jgi:hypothetical protein